MGSGAEAYNELYQGKPWFAPSDKQWGEMWGSGDTLQMGLWHLSPRHFKYSKDSVPALNLDFERFVYIFCVHVDMCTQAQLPIIYKAHSLSSPHTQKHTSTPIPTLDTFLAS